MAQCQRRCQLAKGARCANLFANQAAWLGRSACQPILQHWTAIEFTVAVVARGGVFAPRQAMNVQRGLALSMVMVLSCLCSVLLLAQWRNLAMAQALGQSAGLRWQLKHSALDTLRLAVDDIRLGASDATQQLGNSSDSHAFFQPPYSSGRCCNRDWGLMSVYRAFAAPLGQTTQRSRLG